MRLESGAGPRHSVRTAVGQKFAWFEGRAAWQSEGHGTFLPKHTETKTKDQANTLHCYYAILAPLWHHCPLLVSRQTGVTYACRLVLGTSTQKDSVTHLRTSPASGRPSGQRDSLAFEHAVQQVAKILNILNQHLKITNLQP